MSINELEIRIEKMQEWERLASKVQAEADACWQSVYCRFQPRHG